MGHGKCLCYRKAARVVISLDCLKGGKTGLDTLVVAEGSQWGKALSSHFQRLSPELEDMKALLSAA